jgi:hypothetical protein
MKNIKLLTSTSGVPCIEYTRPTADFDIFGNVVLPSGTSNIKPVYRGSNNNKDYYSFNNVQERTEFLGGI